MLKYRKLNVEENEKRQLHDKKKKALKTTMEL